MIFLQRLAVVLQVAAMNFITLLFSDLFMAL